MGDSRPRTLMPAAAQRSALELWGGLEGTVNRVGDIYFDQLRRSGHASRTEDLDRIAALGVRTVRYPVLWERVAPEGLDRADWSWPDERLGRLRELGVNPIAGLVHHGSGPRHTNLLDPGFAAGLAEYGRAVAERYPWLRDFTPVNEPLTTARFSALYGHWYPHAKDGLSWARALLTECRATVLTMRAIREVTPRARLVQTEDMGKTHSTAALAYQAEFENERRWITFDLLCGRVHPGHRMWQYLSWLGVAEDELRWFQENPCPPDVLGINHYLTSERFLDEKIERYPLHVIGGNGQHRYADVEAVRARAQGIEGPGALLLETWERYRLPVAVTEAHLSSTREEQMRWLLEVWRGAEAARNAGADVRAVTVWSLFGAYNWNSLVTRDDDFYEPGAYDLRAPEPRPTAITWAMRELSAGREPQHPVLDEPGWWRRPTTRLGHEPVRSVQPRGRLAMTQRRFSMRTIRRANRVAPLALVTGRGSAAALSRTFARLCDLRAVPYRIVEADDVAAVTGLLAGAAGAPRPWGVIALPGETRSRLGADSMASTGGSRGVADDSVAGLSWLPALARECAGTSTPLVLLSSDVVFDGRKNGLYVESDHPAPLTAHGRALAAAERLVREAHAAALVVRTGPLYGHGDGRDALSVALRRLEAGRRVAEPTLQVASPTYAPDLVNAAIDLLLDGETGTWHVTNPGALTWLQLVEQAASMAGIDSARLEAAKAPSRKALPLPANTALGSERGALLPPVNDALERYLRDRRWARESRQFRQPAAAGARRLGGVPGAWQAAA